MEGKFDNMLFSMLKDCKTLPTFLDGVFGFLRRRTDFYHIMTDENSPVGLPPGMAEQAVKQAFFKWKSDDLSPILPVGKVPEPVQEVCIDSSTDQAEDLLAKPVETVSEKAENVKSPGDDKYSSFSSSECYNGAVYENYSWSQNISDVVITVQVPTSDTSKDLDIQVRTKNISVKLKSGTKLLDDELCQKCKPGETIWSVSNGKLEIHLHKCREMWWDCLLMSEPRLDVQKMDCSRPYEELPEEAQAKIEELQWNQERKRLGLPTSDQLAMQDRLRQAWNAEGSPFTGPFDPDAVIIQ